MTHSEASDLCEIFEYLCNVMIIGFFAIALNAPGKRHNRPDSTGSRAAAHIVRARGRLVILRLRAKHSVGLLSGAGMLEANVNGTIWKEPLWQRQP
jgi:hypothetical protein